jgi:hypothetical protein
MNKFLCLARQVMAQPQQAQSLAAKGFDADRHGLAVGPEDLIPLEGDVILMVVSIGVSTKENC